MQNAVITEHTAHNNPFLTSDSPIKQYVKAKKKDINA